MIQSKASAGRVVRSTLHRFRIQQLKRGRAFSQTWLTYDAASFTDGAGAQFHRILGIYALSQALGANYLHTPISRLDYQGLPVPGRLAEQEVIAHFESLTRLAELSVPPPADADHIHLRELNVLRFKAPRRPTVIHLLFPHGEIDLNPAVWVHLAPARRMAAPRKAPFRVALHVRRGELHHYDQHRMLPNSYYMRAARDALALAPSPSEARVELYSETLPVGTMVRRGEFFTGALDRDVVIDTDRDQFGEFGSLPNLDLKLNLNLAATIDGLISADVLVMSKSSLSMVAGLLNPDRPVLYPSFWHAAMPGWTTTRPDGSFGPLKR